MGHLNSTIYVMMVKLMLKCHILQDCVLVMLEEEIRVTCVHDVTLSKSAGSIHGRFIRACNRPFTTAPWAQLVQPAHYH